MKEIVRTTIVEHKEVRYEASDGTIFLNKQDCASYEAKQTKKALLERPDIITCEEARGYPPFNGGENYESHDWMWFMPTSLAGATALVDAFDLQAIISGTPANPNLLIGQWICVESDDTGKYYFSRLSDDLAYVRDVCTLLDYNEFTCDLCDPNHNIDAATEKVDEKSYFAFVLGYDLLNKELSGSKHPECDLSYDFCLSLAEKFMKSKEYHNLNRSGYDMLKVWLANNRHLTEDHLGNKEVQ